MNRFWMFNSRYLIVSSKKTSTRSLLLHHRLQHRPHHPDRHPYINHRHPPNPQSSRQPHSYNAQQTTTDYNAAVGDTHSVSPTAPPHSSTRNSPKSATRSLQPRRTVRRITSRPSMPTPRWLKPTRSTTIFSLTSAPRWLKLTHASYSPLLTTDSQPVQNVEPLILSKRYSSPENYMLRKITNSPFQDYTRPRKITESESFSGLLKPLSLSHTWCNRKPTV